MPNHNVGRFINWEEVIAALYARQASRLPHEPRCASNFTARAIVFKGEASPVDSKCNCARGELLNEIGVL